MAQIGERIERSESLLGPTGRFDGFVPLMFHPSALPSTLSPLRPFATVACKYERSFIRTESNSPNNVFLPPCSDARSVRRWFPSVRECTVIPFLRAADCRKREAAGVDEERGHDAREREGGKSPDNQRLWRRAIVLPILRGVVKDACYERRTDKMTDRNKFSFSRQRHCRPVSPRSKTTAVVNDRGCAFLTYYSRDSAISAQNALHEKRTLPGSPSSNNYADLAAHRGNRGRFRGAKDIEKTREGEEEIDEDGGTPRRDGMEMVGDWKPRGGVTPEEKQAE
ncbi:CUG-BP- and ETR-3-like factor 3 [Acromyrmex echinatior]|uniref:CUG-BP-and ETR-3-like factor 3 n=1 Tax=Acromyrmex echinatior TaxID=103372 RepID=F4X611_ACREC|nr:CUG-BP- and ETR-3-like factor 3 [Acromyrmex echinatior]